MDELEKEVIEAGAKAVVAPFAKPLTDLIGWAGGDFLEDLRKDKRERRAANQAKILERAGEIIKERGANPDVETPPEYLEDIIQAAQDNNVQELRELFARLAAAAVDPNRRQGYRCEFVDIVKRMEPIDALVLPAMVNANVGGPNWVEAVRKQVDRDPAEIQLSAVNLERLGCLYTAEDKRVEGVAFLSALGRQLVKIISN
jgi:hypothetical protein